MRRIRQQDDVWGDWGRWRIIKKMLVMMMVMIVIIMMIMVIIMMMVITWQDVRPAFPPPQCLTYPIKIINYHKRLIMIIIMIIIIMIIIIIINQDLSLLPALLLSSSRVDDSERFSPTSRATWQTMIIIYLQQNMVQDIQNTWSCSSSTFLSPCLVSSRSHSSSPESRATSSSARCSDGREGSWELKWDMFFLFSFGVPE